MCVRITLLLGLLLCTPPAVSRAAQAPAKDLAGMWVGKLNVATAKLTFVFHFSKGDDGKLVCKLDVLEQGLKGLKSDEVEWKDDSLRVSWKALQASYAGALKEGELVGEWQQRIKLPLTFKRTNELPTPVRPQHPKPPYPYRSEEVVIASRAADVKLDGTLTLPAGKGPFPAAILLTGSGPQDRDETLFGHKPFLVLADHLTRKGVAVLRCDDRGVGKSTGVFKTATMLDFADDAQGCFTFLQKHKEIAADRIGFIGHSEGGVVGPLTAARNHAVAFVVMLAGPTLPGDEILMMQGRAVLRATGASQEIIALQQAANKKIFAILKETPDKDAAEQQIRAALAKWIKELPEDQKKDAEAIIEKVEQQISFITAPWARHFLSYDPREALRKLQCPVLALFGSKDVQVPARENMQALQAVITATGKQNITMKELPNLNHIFQNSVTGGVQEYGSIEETLAPAALAIISTWILEKTRTPQ